jgi:hypothetical protein
MTMQEQENIRQKGYAKAMRYMANAKDMLERAGRDGDFFEDSKCVKSASEKAYKGVLAAMEVLAEIKKIPAPEEYRGKNIDYYKGVFSDNFRLWATLDSAYKILHLSGYFDGNLHVPSMKIGFRHAKTLINLIKPREAAL